MIELMKYTYMLDSSEVQKELDNLWENYQKIIENKNSNWESLNRARAILFLLGDIYCEKIAVEAIERRLHLMKEKISLLEFFNIIDSKSKKLKELRKDELFVKLEKFYLIVREFKNKHVGGKYYLGEEKFIERYNSMAPREELKIGYKGTRK